MIYLFEDFSKTIKQLRVENNLTQESLARQLGVSVSTICRWERGKYVNPTSKNLIDLCLLFDVSLNTLAGIKQETILYIDMLTSNQQRLIEALASKFSGQLRSGSLCLNQNQILSMLIEEFAK